MFGNIRSGLRSVSIIGLLLGIALLWGGCSTVRLGYNNAPSLLTWWLDAYLDFDTTQSARVRADLQNVHEWHRKEELPQLAAILKEMQAASAGALSAEEACRFSDLLEARVMRLTERALPLAADAALTLTPAQLDHLQAAFDKRNIEWREQWLDGPPAERAQNRLKKLIERTESFYGPLTQDQMAMLKQQIATSAFDPPVQYREVLRRQEDTLQVLRALRPANASAAQAQQALKALVARTRQSPDAKFAAYSDRLRLSGCAAVARFHSTTSTTQRAQLQQTLKDYETDARALMQP